VKRAYPAGRSYGVAGAFHHVETYGKPNESGMGFATRAGDDECAHRFFLFIRPGVRRKIRIQREVEQMMKMKKRLIEGLTLGFLWTDRAILSDALAWLQEVSERFLA